MKRFTEEHEWVHINGDTAVIGITSHAAGELGDITFVEMPELHDKFAQGDVLSVVESVTAASDVYCPVSGRVVAVNSALEGNPEMINDSPEQNGWICKLSDIKLDEIEGLMTEDEYLDFIE